MTPRERIRTAMNLGMPDRVPVMAQLSIGHMLVQLGASPVDFWHDQATFAEGLVRLRELYQFDGILVSLHGHDPGWRHQVRERKIVEGEEMVIWNNGDAMVYPPDDLPRPLSPPPPTVALAELSSSRPPGVLEYIPVSQGLRFRIHAANRFDIFRILRKKAGEDISIHGEVTSPFDYYLDFVGHEQGLVGLVEFPNEARRVLSAFSLLVSGLAKEMCKEDIDAVKISSPFAGAGFISPEMYREFVLPCETPVVQAIQQNGIPAYLHTCGSIGDRLEIMLESGVRGLECLDPPPLGNVELEEAKKRVQGRAFIKGNVDSVHTLLEKETADILNDLKMRIRVGKAGGGFILSTACSVAPRVEREKIRLLRQAADRWGGTP